MFYAGEVSAAAEAAWLSDTQHLAVKELRALLVWVLLQLGILYDYQVKSAIAHRAGIFATCRLPRCGCKVGAAHAAQAAEDFPCPQASVFLAFEAMVGTSSVEHRIERRAGLQAITKVLQRCGGQRLFLTRAGLATARGASVLCRHELTSSCHQEQFRWHQTPTSSFHCFVSSRPSFLMRRPILEMHWHQQPGWVLYCVCLGLHAIGMPGAAEQPVCARRAAAAAC